MHLTMRKQIINVPCKRLFEFSVAARSRLLEMS